MRGRVCGVHEEYCPTGECRWCEPLPTGGYVPTDLPPAQMNGQQLQQAMDDCWARLGQANQGIQQHAMYMPNAIGVVTDINQATGTITFSANATATSSSFWWGYPPLNWIGL